MDREKILAFLNIDTKKAIDKSVMKIITWFNVSFVLFILLVEFLLMGFYWHSAFFLIFSLVTNILFFIKLKRIHKHVHELFYSLIVASTSVIVLLYGWFVFSEIDIKFDEFPRFTWMHFAVLLAALGFSSYMILKFVWVYKLLKEHSIFDAQMIINQKAPIYYGLIFAGSPMVIVRALRGPFQEMGLGLGFGIWVLMCIWLLFVMMLLPKIFVIIKYDVYKWE